jgi:Ca2+-binding RTX toxin-like protein
MKRMRTILCACLALALVPAASPVAAARTYRCKGLIATLVGSERDDVIRGTPRADVIVGRAGDDLIRGLEHRDIICGNRGDDTIYGNSERDRNGDIDGRTQELSGGPGRDTLYSGQFAIMKGDKGADRLIVDGRFAHVYGGADDDDLDATEARQGAFFYGGPGDDEMRGGEGNDDIVVFRHADGPVQIDLAAQTVAGQGNDVVSGMDHAEGSPFDDVIVGNAGANHLWGEGGGDRIEGLEGSDRLTGDGNNDPDGADTLIGGDGDDYFLPDLDGGNDDVVDGGPGTDTLNAFLSPSTIDLSQGTASGAVGNDTLTGIENVEGAGYEDTLIGDEGANVLIGHGGRDFIDGRGGNDKIIGEAGPGVNWYTQEDFDTILGGDGDDNITSEQGRDEIDGGPGNDTIDAGRNIDAVVGGPGDDTIGGSSGDDDLDGSEGTDVLDGGPGQDTCRNGESLSDCEG